MRHQHRAALEQITRVRRADRLPAGRIGDSRARPRQHHQGGRKIQTRCRGVHPDLLAAFGRKRKGNVENLPIGRNYSPIASPEPPNSAGKSFSFGKPSFIRSTVSA